ncbi:MAG: hypothetical protein H3C54_01165 [Taibaiella sp.]|nr:hypothetical protein [Taibaiella sp.]
MKARICLLVFILCSVTTYSQIKPGLYGRRMSSFYVYVKNDTAYTESIRVHTAVAWVVENSRDTLIKQNSSSFSGSRYSFVFEKDKYYLVETNHEKKRQRKRKLIPANEKMIQYWDEGRNLLVLMQLYKRYPQLNNRLWVDYQSEEGKKMREAYWELEGILGIKQEPFLEEVRKFEDTYLR